MRTQQCKHLYYYCSNGANYLSYEVLNSFFIPSVLIFFTDFLQSCGSVFVTFLLMPQTRMVRSSYALPGKIHTGTIHFCAYSIEGCLLYLVSLASYFQAHHNASSFFYLCQKTSLHGRILGTVLVLSDLPLAKIHIIVTHRDCI